MKRTVTSLLAIALIAFVGCKTEKREPLEPEILSKPSGVRYQDLVVGKGVEAVLGSQVQCHYTLWLGDSTGLVKGQFLQSSKDTNQPFTCTLGQSLIAGWSDGMVGMKEGGTRRIFIPWEQGYGVQGRPPMIPAKTNLVFEIEFLSAVK
jgi:FKBP-type peptidyl-prolyl cis-trans isomerase